MILIVGSADYTIPVSVSTLYLVTFIQAYKEMLETIIQNKQAH